MAQINKSVLIVEDNKDLRETLADRLKERGYEVFEAADVESALTCLQESSLPCLIILDLLMPHLSGWRLLEKKDADPDLASVPVIICSAVVGVFEITSSPSIVAAVAKPFEMGRLLSLVDYHCVSSTVEPSADE